MNVPTNTEMIYRFRHFNFRDENHTKEPEQILCESRLWCSAPTKLNDPFDCTPHFVMSEIPLDEQVRRAEAMIRRRGLSLYHPMAVTVIERARAGAFNLSEMHAKLSFGMQQAIHGSSICCFSATWDDPRMWAQYADNHQGYCVALQLDGDWPEAVVPFHVKYTEERPQVDLAVDTMTDQEAAWQYVEASVFTKSHHWAGEREVRIFRQDTSAGLQSFPASALKALYVAMNISESNKARLAAAVRRREQPVPIYQLQPHPSQYTFDLVEMNCAA